MSPCTCSQTPEGALEHVLGFLNNKNFGLIFKENEINNVFDLMSVDMEDLRTASAMDGVNMVTLKAGQLGKLKKLIQWFQQQENPNVKTWFQLNPERFQAFLIQGPTTTSNDAHRISSINVPKSSGGLLYGVKRSITDYPRLRED